MSETTPRIRWEDDGYPADWPEYHFPMSIHCGRGDCGLCRWPLCGCPHHEDEQR